MRSTLLPLLGIVVAALCVGCEHTRPKPQLITNPDGSVSTYKRYERFAQRDFFNRFSRKAYRRAKESDFDLNRPGQETLIEQWGWPDYVRKPFKSLEDEKVQEWVYLNEQYVYQFVDRQIVYEGPLTDYEQLLMRKGYPDRMETSIGESGIARTYFVYWNVFLPGRLETYSLNNGWIAHNHDGN